MQRAERMRNVLTTAYNNWSRHRSARLGAALAYYSVFSLGPLLLIVISVAGIMFGQDAVRGSLTAQFRELLGPDGEQAVEAMLKGAASKQTGGIAALFGVALLLIAALGVVVQLKDALNTIWEAPEPEGSGAGWYVRTYLISLAGVMALGFLLMVSLVVSAALAAVSTWAGSAGSQVLLWQSMNFAVSLVVLTNLFAVLFKWFPDVPVRWRDVWPGALASAVLFEAGKLAIAWYIARQGLQSTYGAAASLVVLLIWVYYTAQIVLFGAEISYAYAQRIPKGSRDGMPPRSEAAPGTFVGPRMENRADNFEKFWWYYLREHGKPETRALHVVGTAFAVLFAAGALRSLATRPGDRYLDPAIWLAAAGLAGYAPAWISHLAYEGNRPATFQHPVWSLLADLKLAWLWATGRLDQQLAVSGIGVAPQGMIAPRRHERRL
ncbi:MAG TPA: YhjD/YihY/BrkB family envelope integrity protein [Methyloceanibacter sp.]